MPDRAFGPLDALLHRLVMRRWRRIAAAADQMGLDGLRRLRLRALELRQVTDRLLFVSNGRLALPLIGSNSFPKPLHSDWSWRPQLWRGPIFPPGQAEVESKTTFGDEVTIFHDCRISELTVRQLRNTHEDDLAPFGLRMDVFQFDGSFLSLVVEMPDSAMRGLGRKHLIRMNAVVETEKPLEIFARLNIQHGPNTEQMVRELPLSDTELSVDFDLAYTKLNEKRVERAWVDLIFEGPEMNQVMLRDVNFSRRPRSEV
ncbi:DUF6478 family protein [Maritimibacter sp. UBA3975]|uniref:DUF6478 family protein n=1 Tax=Maritimibacter sp. UBA3975 TaxID=1946833 RepID=UPI000C08FC8D|nr:DUF6478 family protein [Maritimibacter sp. UBA3975]MAM63750.1 hypothetical protein [Maritimibacter sp.]|tara:strand:+ start:21541 stop:22314 length:774 start_codon:yes stop_codon:yes gene_type:complete